MKRETPEKPHEIVTFETWSEFITYVSQDMPKDVYQQSSVKNGNDFNGGLSFDEASTMAITGWDEGTKQVKTFTDALVNKVMDKISVPVIHYDIEGIDFDMGRVNRSEPEAWYRFEEHTVKAEGDNVVTIVVNAATSAGISTETMILRGSIICALVELLEYSHRKVSVIYSCPWSTGSRITVEYRALIKAASQPLDMSRLTFCLAHPAMYRRLMFRSIELRPKDHAECGFGYGMPTDVPDKGDIYFGRMLYDKSEPWNSNPEAFIMEKLAAQGIELLG